MLNSWMAASLQMSRLRMPYCDRLALDRWSRYVRRTQLILVSPRVAQEPGREVDDQAIGEHHGYLSHAQPAYVMASRVKFFRQLFALEQKSARPHESWRCSGARQ